MNVSTILTVFVISNTLYHASPAYLQKTENIDKDDLMIFDKYIEMDKKIQHLVSNGIKNVLPYAMEASEHLNVSSNCKRNIFTLVSEVKKLKLSALKFLDAAGKLPPGFLTLTFNMFGDYDECLSTEVLRADGEVIFHGQYCLISIAAFLPKKKRIITISTGLEELLEYAKNTSELMQYALKKVQMSLTSPLKYGICVPSGCTTEDVSETVKYIGENLFINATLQYCEEQREFQFNSGVLVAIFYISVIGLLAVVGSSVDYYSRRKGTHFKKMIAMFLVCFSVFTNFPKVINTKTQDTAMNSLFGIRTLSLFFIILLHQYLCWGVFRMNGHGEAFLDQMPEFFSQVIYNGFLTSEVFFFLGGLLNAYVRTNIHSHGKHQPSTAQIIIHRLWRNAKIGIILHMGILIAGVMATVLWAWHKDVLPFAMAYRVEKDVLKKVWNAYATILPHIAPYFTGLILGFVLSKWNQFKIPRVYRYIGWPTASACFISMLFITQKWSSGVEFTAIESALYFGFSRLLYVLAVAWMVICCSRGYGGILNYILSLKVWIPFARISYMVFMVSLPLQIYYYASLRMLLDVDRMTMIWRHIENLGVSCLLSLVMVVVMESPFISMEKLIFHKPSKHKTSDNNVDNSEKYTNNVETIKETELVKN